MAFVVLILTESLTHQIDAHRLISAALQDAILIKLKQVQQLLVVKFLKLAPNNSVLKDFVNQETLVRLKVWIFDKFVTLFTHMGP